MKRAEYEVIMVMCLGSTDQKLEAKSKKEVKLLKKGSIRAAAVLLTLVMLLSTFAIGASAQTQQRSGFPAGSSTVNIELAFSSIVDKIPRRGRGRPHGCARCCRE